MSSSLSLFLAFASLALASPHFEYRAIGLRANNGSTTTAPPTSTVGTMPMVTDTNVFNLSSYCDAQQSTYFSTYSATKLITTVVTSYQGFLGTGTQSTVVTSQSYETATITYTEPANDAYASGGAKPPCCSTCLFSVGTIQFYWWPDLATATAGSISTTVNNGEPPVTAVAPNGFTFTSPSVYMAFSSIYARNRCSTVGDAWYNTTIGFHPNEMTTVNAYTTTYTSLRTHTEDGSTEVEQVTARGYRPPPSPLHYSDLAKNCSSMPGYVYFPDDPQNDLVGTSEQDPCHPILQLPDSLISMQPEWANNNCKALPGFGAYDPPQALTAAAVEDKPTLPTPAPGSTGSTESTPATTAFTAQPDNTPTSSAGTSSAAAPPPETTRTNGGQSSSSTPTVAPSPVIESSASALQPAQSESATLASPGIQSSANELQTPSATTNNGGQQQSQLPTPNTPQIESSQAAVIAPQPVGSDTTTQIVGQAPASPSPVAQETAAGTTVISSVIPAQNGGASKQGATQSPVIAVGSQTLTADASSNFVVNGQTISANGATVTVDNTPVALLAGGQTAVVGGSTTLVAAVTPAADSAASVTVGNNVLKANTEGGYVVAPGTTLSLGGSSVTVDNTAYALKTNDAGETMLVAGAAATSTSSGNIGNYILSGINGQNNTSSNSAKSSTAKSSSSTSGNQATSAGPSVAIQTAGAVTIRNSSALMLCLLALLAMI